MAIYNFTFKVIAGKQTETKIILHETSGKAKAMKFKSGLVKTNSEFALELQNYLNSMINEIENEEERRLSKS